MRLSRAIIRDIDETWKAIKDAQKKCFHIFISSSDIQIKHQLGKTEKDVLEIVKALYIMQSSIPTR